MLIDCDTCVARDVACSGCVIGVLLGGQSADVELDAEEQAAIGSLARAGLVPPLRLVLPMTGPDPGDQSDLPDFGGSARGIA
jgi:hypothetical protein